MEEIRKLVAESVGKEMEGMRQEVNKLKLETEQLKKQWRGNKGGLAGAEPLQLFGWGGARNVFEPPPPPQLEESWSAKK